MTELVGIVTLIAGQGRAGLKDPLFSSGARPASPSDTFTMNGNQLMAGL